MLGVDTLIEPVLIYINHPVLPALSMQLFFDDKSECGFDRVAIKVWIMHGGKVVHHTSYIIHPSHITYLLYVLSFC